MKKWLRIIAAILLGLALLAVVPLKHLSRCPGAAQIAENLDLIGAFITRYSWLITVIALCILVNRFQLKSSTLKLLGFEIELKRTERRVKAQVRNYLSSKRSIFVFYDDYDNQYDCISSMYEILKFLRTQLEAFDEPKNETYQKIERIIRELGRFLTKYQSDYRKYYELQQKKMENDPKRFRTFQQIQDSYPKSKKMRRDFHLLNQTMKQYAQFFDIDIQKWKNW